MDAFRRQFEQLSAEADALAAPLSDDAFARRPSPDRWSVAECIEHLNVSARRYLPVIDEGIAAAVRRGLYGTGPFTYNWLGRVFVWTMEPPPRFRAKAPAVLQPEAVRPKQDVLAGFRAYQVQYIDRLHAASGLDLARARVRSPVAAWLRMPLGSAFQLMAAHERRHLWQARQAVDQLRADGRT
jgi:hypothetical protein